MTAEQLKAEADYRHAERLGILCGSAEPTPEQRKIADEERAEFLRLNEKLTQDARR